MVKATPIVSSSRRIAALRVTVETILGLLIIDMRSSRSEIEVIEVPNAATGSIDRLPGSIWFYTSKGDEVGILPLSNALNYQHPGAVVLPRTGPSIRRSGGSGGDGRSDTGT